MKTMADLPNNWSPARPQASERSMNTQQQLDDFIDDFDDDDDVFFSAARTQEVVEAQESDHAAAGQDSFGMLSLNHDFPEERPSENKNADLKKIELYLAHLRNANSCYRHVAFSCLAIHQLLYNNPCSAQNSQSTTIVYSQEQKEAIHTTVTEALLTCLSHNIDAARILAAKTLGVFLRSNLSITDVDQMFSNYEERIRDDCLGAAHTLVITALDEGDAVSSAALESLGLFILDSESDILAAEVYALAENGDPNSLIFTTRNFQSLSPKALEGMQYTVFSSIIFPRMSKLLRRISRYAPQHLLKVLPVITAAFESALVKCNETCPLYRSIATTKAGHGKRGWFETDAANLVNDYFSILSNSFDNKQLARGAAVACLRLANAHPQASWRGEVSRGSVGALVEVLNQEINDENTLISSNDNAEENVDSVLSSSATYHEKIGGTVALLLIALRGVPLCERAEGLVLALRAVMLFIPMGVSVPHEARRARLDTPSVSMADEINMHRLGRVGLLTEIALLIMVDTNSKIESLKADELIEQPSPVESNDEKFEGKILGARAILLNRIFQSYHLSSAWDVQQKKNSRSYRPVDDMIWVFCSVLSQLSRNLDHVFSKDFSYLIEWSNIALVMLNNSGKFICRPITSSPFSRAAHAMYFDLMTILMKKSGLVPTSALSIHENMLPNLVWTECDILHSPVLVKSNTFNMSFVGGPGRQMPHVSTALAKVCQNVLILWSKSRTAYSLSEDSMGTQSSVNIVMAAILVDAWIGKCIINYDSKESNESQLELASSLLALIQTEMNSLLDSHELQNESKGVLTFLIKNDPSSYCNATVHLFRVCMASLESVAKMSVVIWNNENKKTENDVEVLEDKIAPLTVSILHGLIGASKEALESNINGGRDAMMLSLYEQVAIDANDTIARIVEFSPAHAKMQPNHDDIITPIPPSPFLLSREGSKGKTSLENLLKFSLTLSSNTTNQGKNTSFNDLSFIKNLQPVFASELHPMHQRSVFLFHHARLVLSRLVAYTAVSSDLMYLDKADSPSKFVHSLNPYRLSSSFQHSVIKSYCCSYDMPVMIPNGDFIGTEPVALTGCSDLVSLAMSYEFQRLRKGEMSDETMLVVMTRLYNITPISIRHGVELGLKMSTNNHCEGNCVVTAVYNGEIKGGEFVTWETAFRTCKADNVSLQATVTFRDMEQESITCKWVSAEDSVCNGSFIQNEEDEALENVTITCRPIKIASTALLQPCPLVFFGSRRRSISGRLGDETVFRFLWFTMNHECSKNIDCKGSSDLSFDGTRGCVILDSSGSNHLSGGAFIAPNGVRVFCLLESKKVGSYTLKVRSDSIAVLQSLVESQNAQSSFMSFLFGNSDATERDNVVRPKLEHDHAPMTMPHYQLEHDFASMTMPHYQLDVSQ